MDLLATPPADREKPRNQRIREAGGSGIRESENQIARNQRAKNQRIREQGKSGIRESGNQDTQESRDQAIRDQKLRETSN